MEGVIKGSIEFVEVKNFFLSFKDDFQSILRSLSPQCLCASFEECEECSYRTNKMVDDSVPSAGLSSVAENWRFLSNEEKEIRRKLYVSEGILRGSIYRTVSSAGEICARIWVCRRTKTWQSSLWTSMSLHKKRIALGKIHFEGIFIYHLSHYSRIQ